MVLTSMAVVGGSNNDIKYRLRKVVPVSGHDDPICNNTLYLSSASPITVGRTLSEDVQVRLLSKNTPLMISRKHASIYLSAEDNQVYVEDHKSMNGVYVGDKRISSSTRHQIKVGDKIAFGCGVGDSGVSEFEYYLETVPTTPTTGRKMESPDTAECEYVQTSPVKRTRRTPRASPAVDAPSLTIIESNAAQIKEQEDKIKQLSDDLELKERAQNDLVNRLEETEKGLLDKLVEQRAQLENERNEAENRLRELLEQQLREKEETLKNEFDEQIRLLQSEKDVVEKNLQNELSSKLSEKDEAYQQALEQQKSSLETAMRDKENEKNTLVAQLQAKEGLLEKYKSVEENQKQLECCLQELRAEIDEKDKELDKQKEFTKKVECDAKQHVIQTMEDEFTCIICQELFIDATTLPCAHSFCELCLRLWLKKKKTCPVCRRKLKVKAFRSVVLDSAIEKMIESMDEDTRLRRVELKRERDEQKRREDSLEGNNASSSKYGQVDDDDSPPSNPHPHPLIVVD